VLPSAIQPWLYAASGGTIGWAGSSSSGSLPGGGVSGALVDTRPGSMLGLGGGDSGSGCFGAQASVSIRTRKLRRIQGIEFLAESGRVELRKHEGSEVRTGVVGGDSKGKGEKIAGFFRRDDGVDESACGSEAGIELLLVVGPH